MNLLPFKGDVYMFIKNLEDIPLFVINKCFSAIAYLWKLIVENFVKLLKWKMILIGIYGLYLLIPSVYVMYEDYLHTESVSISYEERIGEYELQMTEFEEINNNLLSENRELREENARYEELLELPFRERSNQPEIIAQRELEEEMRRGIERAKREAPGGPESIGYRAFESCISTLNIVAGGMDVSRVTNCTSNVEVRLCIQSRANFHGMVSTRSARSCASGVL